MLDYISQKQCKILIYKQYGRMVCEEIKDSLE